MTTNQNDVTIQTNPVAEIGVERIGLKAGLITCSSLIVYFMIMKFLNIMDSASAWGLNFIILWAGIIFAFRVYRSKTKLNMDYVPGLILGGITTAVSVFSFMIFVYLYFSNADTAMMLSLKDNILFMGEEVTPVRAAGATMIEGICSGVIITFMMMQYFRSGFRRARGEKVAHG